MLDAEEYFHLAINATQQGLHHSAMEYLYKCLEQQPENANAIFLLAAEHAELGLFKRAIEGMRKSIELDDKLEMAYYQLALLYLQQGDEAKAYPLWQHLSGQSTDKALNEFSKGMLLFDTSPSEALIYFDRAQEITTNNKFLTQSMKSISDNLRNSISTSQTLDTIKTKESTSVHEIFVNAYKDSLFDGNE